MTKQLEFYKCEICGNIVQVFHEGAGELVCCEKPMIKLEPNTQEAEFKEKHAPVFSDDMSVQVGSVIHPMTEEHHIEFIQCVSNDEKIIYTKFLNRNNEPVFNPKNNIEFNKATEYCNLHGMWQSKK